MFAVSIVIIQYSTVQYSTVTVTVTVTVTTQYSTVHRYSSTVQYRKSSETKIVCKIQKQCMKETKGFTIRKVIYIMLCECVSV